MYNVTLVCGKTERKFYSEACEEYCKRLSRSQPIVELKEERLPDSPSQAQIDAALAREADAIRAKLPPGASVVALCIEGRMRSSEEMARLIAAWSNSSAKHLVFVIGGSFGLHPSLKAEAWAQLSMSPMTFPHHLARVMLLEQLYRSFQILEGSKYHK
ncbi:MAG: 23S rRNA (pseudouridine(1915)-N(3))-methyltransferase RlmH [Ruthenibacterium lactatiformans]|uniref:23S rRNA (pseudouridine(1915)-N(3))-methyltransferase RlmH n=1 Tax=Ruthenibacterium lactatiformans TaxID=1550024 RepID=UPI00399516B7